MQWFAAGTEFTVPRHVADHQVSVPVLIELQVMLPRKAVMKFD